MTEYEIEPIPGLPGLLPPGERILWQGAPDWRALARHAFHTRLVAGYFAGLTLVALLAADGRYVGTGMTAALGLVAIALLHALAWGAARTTLYTLTNRRIVLRIGIAVPKCVNLPLPMIAAVDFAGRADATGDLPLRLTGAPRLGYLALWPHARPWAIARPQPMLRCLPDAANVAALVARTCLAACPDGRIAPAPLPADTVPALTRAHAA